jgi:hypothetical protein
MTIGRNPAIKSTIPNPRPILVSVYKLIPHPKIIRQYYQFVFGPRDETHSVDSCPGCGQALRYRANEHQCKGTLLPEPIKALNIKELDQNTCLRQDE